MAKAGGVDILLRAQGAEQTQAALRETAKDLRDLGKAGSEGSAGMTEVERALGLARGKVAGLAGVGQGVVGAIPASAALGVNEYARGADRLQTALNRVGREGESTARQLGLLGRLGFGAEMTTGANALGFAIGKIGAAVGGLAAGAVSIYALSAAFKSAVASAAESEEATLKAAAALQATGQYSAQALRGMQEFASSVQRVSTLSDEAALNLASLIARMTGVTGEPLERMTRAAVDLNAALGTGAEQAARIFAQLQAGEVTGLTRLGIRLDESVPKAERLRAGLEAIERTFGGAAAAAIEGYTGSVARLRNALSDLGEAIGYFALPALTSAAQGLTRLFESLSGTLAAQREMAQLTANEMVRLIDLSQQAVAAGDKAAESAARRIEDLKKRALVEIALEVKRGSVDQALAALDELEERRKRGADTAVDDAAARALREQTERAAQAVRGLAASQQLDVGEIVLGVRAMVEAGDFEAVDRKIADLRAMAEHFPALRLDVSEVIRQIEEARKPLSTFLDELQAKGEADFKVRLEADLAAVKGDMANYRQVLEGEGIEVLIRGTPDFRDASAEMERLRQEEEQKQAESVRRATSAMHGAALPVSFAGPTAADAEQAAARGQTLLSEETADLPPTMQAIAYVAGPRPTMPDSAALEVGIKFKADDPRAGLAEAQAAIAAEGSKLQADVRLKIEGAKDADELADILKGLEAEFGKLHQAAIREGLGSLKAAEAEEFRKVNVEAKKLADMRLGNLRNADAIAALDELTRGLQQAQAAAEKGLPAPTAGAEGFRTLAESAKQARDAIAAISEAPTPEAARAQFKAAQGALEALQQKFPAFSREWKALLAQLEGPERAEVEVRLSAESASKQLQGLIGLAEKLGEAAGTLNLSDKANLVLFGQDASAAAMSVAEIEEALERMRSGVLTVEELEKAVAGLGEAVRSIDAGKLDVGSELESQIRGALKQLGDTKGMSQATQQVDRLEEKLAQARDRLTELSMDAPAEILGAAFSSMLLDADNFSANMVSIFKSMVDALIKELARIAVLQFLKSLVGGPLAWVAPGPSSPAATIGTGQSGTTTVPAPSLKVAPSAPVPPVQIDIPIAVVEPDVPTPERVKVPAPILEQQPAAAPVVRQEPAARQQVTIPAPRVSVGALPAIRLQAPAVATARPSTIGAGAAVHSKPALAPPPGSEGLRFPTLTGAVAALLGGARDMVPATALIAQGAAESRAGQLANLALASGLRSLVPSRSLIEQFAPAARQTATRQMSVAISAQDAGSFERWLRTGSGRRALEALSNAGAGL